MSLGYAIDIIWRQSSEGKVIANVGRVEVIKLDQTNGLPSAIYVLPRNRGRNCRRWFPRRDQSCLIFRSTGGRAVARVLFFNAISLQTQFISDVIIIFVGV